MAKKKRLDKKQIAVIEELVNGKLDEHETLKKYGVRRSTFNRWLRERLFVAELDRRVGWLKFRGDLTVARCKSEAADQLSKLTASDKPETARKACLDILRLDEAADFGSEQCEGKCSDEEGQYEDLSAETAGKLLAVLAEENSEKT